MTQAQSQIRRFTGPLFRPNFLSIKLLATAYVAAIPLAHGLLPETLVWPIAVVFLLAMLFTYPLAAWSLKHAVRTETCLSLGLAILGLIGLATSPLLIIAAIFGHGVWDLAKHRGCGIPFFGWYVSGCVIVDWLYAAALLAYWITL